MADRCPRCGGAIKPGAQWCGLCYADLRPPPPAPVAPPVAPVAAGPAPLFAPVAAADAAPGVDGEVDGQVAQAPAAPRKGWPCVECGTINPFEAELCVGCGQPFGAALRSQTPAIPGDRRTRIGVAVGVVLLLMAIIAVISVATTGDPPPEKDPSGIIVVDG